MIDHLGINVPDLARAKAYYDALMPLLGFEPFVVGDDQFSYRPAGGKTGTYFFFYPTLEAGDYSRHRIGLQHLAFYVRSRQVVRDALAKAIELGSERILEAQVFPQYHANYYAAFWYDPHGFMLEAVCHRAEA
jgi:catechol 2,3-dioxygenase-like lactoylglutathione lyase family enzyme